MKTEKRRLGDLGEDAAAKYLRKNKIKILERNFTYGPHEIDIIAANREFLIFVEVKTRTHREETIAQYGRACEAVDHRKRHSMLCAVRGYCKSTPPKKKIRLDVVEVYFENTDPPKLHAIHHMPDAFRIE
ncbi:MAG: YraN family protein [Clostridia bacterium]|nr:YraN family protein [Clostridia bacterium]